MKIQRTFIYCKLIFILFKMSNTFFHDKILQIKLLIDRLWGVQNKQRTYNNLYTSLLFILLMNEL